MPSFETVVAGRLTVHTYTRFAPFCYQEEGSIVGTDIDFLKAFAEHEGVSAHFETTDFPAIWELPGAGECDVAAYAGGDTSNRFVAEADDRLAVVDVHDMDETETLHFAVRAADPRLLQVLDAFISSRGDRLR